MITFTKEQLIASAHARIEFAEMMLAGELEPLKESTWSIELELARIALASLEAEPVAYTEKCEITNMQATGLYLRGFPDNSQGRDIALYTAPPAPVSVPDEATSENIEILASTFAPRAVTYQWDRDECNAAADSWNACRAAMLQGAENAESRCTIQTAPALDSSQKIAKSRCSNSPVIPGCSCRTCRPVTMTDMRFVVCPECGNKRCPHANDHRHECTGSNEPGQEGSAYPAAPQQEVTQALAKGMERYGDAMQELAKKEEK